MYVLQFPQHAIPAYPLMCYMIDFSSNYKVEL